MSTQDALVPEGSDADAAHDEASDQTVAEPRRARRTAGPNILLVDGDDATRKAIASSLRQAGYEVKTAQSGSDALDAARAAEPNLVILEATLPGRIDGFETCRLLRLHVDCPVIFVSGRTAEIDRVVGLEVGADDYVTKPFGMRELLARVAAHLRRASMPMIEVYQDDLSPNEGEWTDTTGKPVVGVADEAGDEARPRRRKGGTDPDILVFDGVTIDAVRREVRIGHRRISLKRREFDLLAYLARNHGIVLSRSQILRAVWPEEFQDYETRTVDVHVSRVRDKVEPDPARPRFVHTIRGTGYQFRVIPPPVEKRKEKHK